MKILKNLNFSKPTCSHGFTEPHLIGGNTGFNYDYPWPCDEWEVSDRGIHTGKLRNHG